MQRLIPDIDSIYVSQPYGFSQMMTKQFKDYKYKKNGILLDSGIKHVTRYAKDYTLGNTNFSLLVICLNKSEKTIEDRLDQVAKDIKKDNKMKSIVGVAGLKPLPLGVNI